MRSAETPWAARPPDGGSCALHLGSNRQGCMLSIRSTPTVGQGARAWCLALAVGAPAQMLYDSSSTVLSNVALVCWRKCPCKAASALVILLIHALESMQPLDLTTTRLKRYHVSTQGQCNHLSVSHSAPRASRRTTKHTVTQDCSTSAAAATASSQRWVSSRR